MRRNISTAPCIWQRYCFFVPSIAAVLAVSPLWLCAGTAVAGDETFVKVADISLPCIVAQVPCLSPTNTGVFDISFVDPKTDLLLVADAANKALDVMQASTHSFLFYVTRGTVKGKAVGFTGFNRQTFDLPHLGPDGVVTVSPTEAWVGDGDSTVKVVDLLSRQITDVISTGGAARADELAYDWRDHVILITNPDEGSATPPRAPFLSLISTKTHTVLKQFQLPKASGIEQPSWSPETGLFYVSIPSVDGNANNSGVAVIDPRAQKLVKIIPTGDCDPNGSAIGRHDLLLLGCSGPTAEIKLLNIRTGHIQTLFVGGGADEVWYNSGDNHFYATSNPFTPQSAIAVFDAGHHNSEEEDGGGVSFDGPLVPTPFGSHSIAANPATNQIFIPVGADATDPNCQFGCIQVYAAPGTDKDDRPVHDHDD